jgi:hypothetical protein
MQGFQRESNLCVHGRQWREGTLAQQSNGEMCDWWFERFPLALCEWSFAVRFRRYGSWFEHSHSGLYELSFAGQQRRLDQSSELLGLQLIS